MSGGGGDTVQEFILNGAIDGAGSISRQELLVNFCDEILHGYIELDALLAEASSYEHLSTSCASCDLRDTSKAQAALIYKRIEVLLNEISRLEQILTDADYALALSCHEDENPSSLHSTSLATTQGGALAHIWIRATALTMKGNELPCATTSTFYAII